MTYAADPTRWAQIENLPLPSGIGDLESGLCASARIVYAATGAVRAMHPCAPKSVLRFLSDLNDSMPDDLRQRLGTRSIRDRVLGAATGDEAERMRMYLFADRLARIFVPRALRADPTDRAQDYARHFESCAPIVDDDTARAATTVAYKFRCEIFGLGNWPIDRVMRRVRSSFGEPSEAAFGVARAASAAGAWDEAMTLLDDVLAVNVNAACCSS